MTLVVAANAHDGSAANTLGRGRFFGQQTGSKFQSFAAMTMCSPPDR